MVTLLEGLQSICHYCLRDNTSPLSPVLSLKPRITRSNSTPVVNADTLQSSTSSVQIFTNLLHAFSVQSAPASEVPSVEVAKHILEAREGLLSVLPKVLASLFSVWSTWSPQRADSNGQRLPSEWPLNLMGSPKVGIFRALKLFYCRNCCHGKKNGCLPPQSWRETDVGNEASCSEAVKESCVWFSIPVRERSSSLVLKTFFLLPFAGYFSLKRAGLRWHISGLSEAWVMSWPLVLIASVGEETDKVKKYISWRPFMRPFAPLRRGTSWRFCLDVVSHSFGYKLNCS